MEVLRNLKIGQKLAMLVIVMGLPVAILVSLFIDARNVQILAAEQELQGVEYLKPLRELLELFPQHRSVATVLLESGEAGARGDLADIQSQVESAITRVDAVNNLYGAAFNTSESWARLKTNWRGLTSDIAGLSAEESGQRHVALMTELIAFIRLVGDRSNLALDPQLDTHFLIDVAVGHLPQMVETTGAIHALGHSVLAGVGGSDFGGEDVGGRQMDVRQSMSRLTGQLDDLAQELERGSGVAFGVNPGLQSDLSGRMSAVDGGLQAFLDLNFQEVVAPLSAGRPPSASSQTAEAYDESVRSVSAALLQLQSAAVDQLELLLTDRIVTLNQEKYFQLMATVLILVIAVVLALFLSRTITAQITEIDTLFGRISVGDLQARAVVRSRDELGQMTASLNQMLDNTLSLVQSKEERDRIERSIEKLLEEISGVAEGDLTQEAEVTAEVTGAIADSFNYMISELRNIIAQVQQTTLQVSAAANDIQSTAELLAAGSEQQSSQIRVTTNAVDEMAESIQRVSANAASAAMVARESLQNALSGSEAVAKSTAGMNAIRSKVQATSKRIKRLGESSQEIGEIVELIRDLSDRTSILALNASIQASTAGEAGRGFAVVAEEVEGLAERAAEATQRIDALIKGIQEDMAEAVTAMEDTTLEVVAGSNLANEAGRKLEQIEAVSKQLAELIQSISQASLEQAKGSENVADSMGQISEVTHQTAQGARSAAHSIRDLAALADELRNSVSRFKIPAMMR